ncbi:MAG: PepSY domain-containing protein [Gammaproteobacteria bacterium]
MISKNRLHRIVGILLLCPLITWCITGTIFLIQPGYGSAYEALNVRHYPLDSLIEIPANPQWQEVRVLRTVLGTHLLVKTDETNLHLNALNGQPFTAVDDAQKQQLIADTIADKPARYGEISSVEDGLYTTTTGIEISLNWDTLSLRQYGNDTRWIDRLYQVHYLQWTGNDLLDKVLGVLGLLLLVAISITGSMMIFKTRTRST